MTMTDQADETTWMTHGVTENVKKRRRQRPARSNINNYRAAKPVLARQGEPVFRIGINAGNVKKLRAWGRRRGFEVADHGPVPARVYEAFEDFLAKDGNGGWTVHIITSTIPGAEKYPPRQYYQVMQGQYEVKLTRFWWKVENLLGDELFQFLILDEEPK